MFYYTKLNSPIGELTIASDENNIIGLWIEGQKYFGSTILDKITLTEDIDILNKTKEWIERYFRGEKPSSFELPIKPIGGEFRQIVWKILREIPYGKVITYGEIAKKVASIQNKEIMSAQAVGGAVGHNPISIIIPCHRVIGVRGDLTGYAGGIEIKKRLLEFEKIKINFKERNNDRKFIFSSNTNR